MAAVQVSAGLGDLLRHWRRVRRKSQLDLAIDALTTPRYLSFVETGRAQPSRQMVVRLARALDGPQLERVQSALAAMLARHEPFPAVVMDRGWTVLRANEGAARLFGGLLAPAPMPEPANVLRLMIEPGPVRDAVSNWDAVVPALLERARREAVGGVLDAETRELVERLRGRADVAAVLAD